MNKLQISGYVEHNYYSRANLAIGHGWAIIGATEAQAFLTVNTVNIHSDLYVVGVDMYVLLY